MCWLYLIQYNNYGITWTFPVSYTSDKYTVQITHYSTVATDQTVKINSRSKTNCYMQGNQWDMHVTALAIGY